MLKWISHRDEVTCKVIHRLWDDNISKYVVQINKVDKRYRIQILDHVPYHTKQLINAKRGSQHIYEQVGSLSEQLSRAHLF
jgi:hypothetical protein